MPAASRQMHVHYLQHSADDGAGTLASALGALGHTLSGTRLHLGETPPALGTFDALVILGGPMNLHQHAEHPWLIAEKAYLRAALATELRLFGICLGAQLLTDACGGHVQRAPQRERGWWPVSQTLAGAKHPLFRQLADPFLAFHWHEDVCELPASLNPLAKSAVTPCQAFSDRSGRVVGLQFHPEIESSAARRWFGVPADGSFAAAVAKDEWPATGAVQDAATILSHPSGFNASATLMQRLAQNFFGSA